MPGSGLTWGIAGYGDVVRRRALPALLAASERVGALWGRDGARARTTAEEFGVGVGTDDYAQLLDRCDVVYVATPVVSHLPLAVAARRAGKPVLIEKPLGLLGRVDPGLESALLAPGPLVGVAYYRRLAPAPLRLRALLSGRAVRSVSVSFRSAFDPGPGDPRLWRTDPAVAGGGVLADIGSHRLDLLLWLQGGPEKVEGELGARFPLGAERSAVMRLAWRGGARAVLEAAWAPGPAQDRLAVEFDGGRLELDPLDSGRISGTVDGTPVSEHLPPPPNPHAPLLHDFARSVVERREPACPVTAAVAVDHLISSVHAESVHPESTNHRG